MNPSLRAIVLLDDSEDDLSILRLVVQKAGLLNPIHAFTRAEDATAFLSATADSVKPEDSALPLACFVDMRMLGFDGFEFIEWVRNHAVFKRMPLIATSASDDANALLTAAKLGAQCYLLKFPTAGMMRELALRANAFHGDGNPHAFDLPGNLFLGRASLPRIDV